MPRSANYAREALDQNTDKSGGPDACWLWTGKRNAGGYGYFKDGTTLAHRAAWEQANGEIPRTDLICHRCDVRRCVNPAHLFLGDHAINDRDARLKGRKGSKGIRHLRTTGAIRNNQINRESWDEFCAPDSQDVNPFIGSGA